MSSALLPEPPFILLSSCCDDDDVVADDDCLALAAAEQLPPEPNDSLRAALTLAAVSQTTDTGIELVDVGVCGGILTKFFNCKKFPQKFSKLRLNLFCAKKLKGKKILAGAVGLSKNFPL